MTPSSILEQISAHLAASPPATHEQFLRGVRSMYERRYRQALKGQFTSLSPSEIKSILSHIKELLNAIRAPTP